MGDDWDARPTLARRPLPETARRDCKPHCRESTQKPGHRSAVASPAILAGVGDPLALRTRRQSTDSTYGALALELIA